jgi:hypothetical protein
MKCLRQRLAAHFYSANIVNMPFLRVLENIFMAYLFGAKSRIFLVLCATNFGGAPMPKRGSLRPFATDLNSWHLAVQRGAGPAVNQSAADSHRSVALTGIHAHGGVHARRLGDV